MITIGSVARGLAAERFEFLAEQYRGRRNAIKTFTHAAPEFVFWIFPGGALFDAKNAHRKNVPRGYEHILDDEPDYGGFLRGRLLVRSVDGFQLVVVYCRAEALTTDGHPLRQLLNGLRRLPVPLDQDALVISDNGDIYGTVEDLVARENGT
ncbi:hypothetical protein [Catenulispora rubra]|uniref:hypothetical protein n=1 Tax=Catenulispora rubra TaxID=280293 RepID=UPI00189257E8|nr:hypothetical protein [Catenulispora rubra]